MKTRSIIVIVALAFATVVGHAQNTTVSMTNTIAAAVTLTNSLVLSAVPSGTTTGLVRCASFKDVAITSRCAMSNGETSPITVTILGSGDGTHFDTVNGKWTWIFSPTGTTTNYCYTNIAVGAVRALLIYTVSGNATNVGSITGLQFTYSSK